MIQCPYVKKHYVFHQNALLEPLYPYEDEKYYCQYCDQIFKKEILDNKPVHE